MNVDDGVASMDEFPDEEKVSGGDSQPGVARAKRGARSALFSSRYGPLALCLGTNKSELCGNVDGNRVHLVTVSEKQCRWHRELVAACAELAATTDICKDAIVSSAFYVKRLCARSA